MAASNPLAQELREELEKTQAEARDLQDKLTAALARSAEPPPLADAVKRAREACGCHGCVLKPPRVLEMSGYGPVLAGDQTPRPSVCLAAMLLEAELKQR